MVTCSREAAALYKETLDRLNAPQSAIIISGSNKDPEHLVRHHTTDDERKDRIKRFCTPGDPLSILVVCDMLLTGFDAPVEQVMYPRLAAEGAHPPAGNRPREPARRRARRTA